MTQTQRSDLDKAIARAQKYGLVILARGTRKSDGARVWGVTSHSRPGYHLHQVVQIGQRLECDCAARVYCSHKAVVHLDLAAEHAAVKAAQVIEARSEARMDATDAILERLMREPAQPRQRECLDCGTLATTGSRCDACQARLAQRRASSPIAPKPATGAAFSIFK